MKINELTPLLSVCQDLGLAVKSTTPQFCIDEGGWEHFLFSYTLLRNGKPLHSGTYRKGSGHVKLVEPKSPVNRLRGYEGNVLRERVKRPNCKIRPSFQGELIDLYNKLASEQKLTLGLDELVYSLTTDGQGTDQSFEDWCVDLGYDADSRKAHSIYTACQEIGWMIRRNFTPEELERIVEASQDF
jgi:hypothetical protein